MNEVPEGWEYLRIEKTGRRFRLVTQFLRNGLSHLDRDAMGIPKTTELTSAEALEIGAKAERWMAAQNAGREKAKRKS